MLSARLLTLSLALAAVATSCRIAPSREQSEGLPAAALPGSLPTRLDIGRAAMPSDIEPIDIDVNPAGAGLPAGNGTYVQGAAIYTRKCAACHGAKGEGIAPAPRLIGAEPRQGFPFGKDFAIPKTIGNYWPYATTLYDYVHRAMPLVAPGSLTPDETYALVAYLLAENDIVPRTAVMNAQTLPKIEMPARTHFVPDDRTGGQPFR
jgi:S-disulfanyl-L-cysteine oxidoreductase SoxD